MAARGTNGKPRVARMTISAIIRIALPCILIGGVIGSILGGVLGSIANGIRVGVILGGVIAFILIQKKIGLFILIMGLVRSRALKLIGSAARKCVTSGFRPLIAHSGSRWTRWIARYCDHYPPSMKSNWQLLFCRDLQKRCHQTIIRGKAVSGAYSFKIRQRTQRDSFVICERANEIRVN